LRVTYDWQPGNGTNYQLITELLDEELEDLAVPGGPNKWLLCWMVKGGSGGVCMKFSGFLHYTYMVEKMGIANLADVAGLLAFVDKKSMATVGMPPGYDESGLWTSK
tara:strand:- start:1883 stop:2203 length:321 start_codon:yes stop_codon:yes gene_type:complete